MGGRNRSDLFLVVRMRMVGGGFPPIFRTAGIPSSACGIAGKLVHETKRGTVHACVS